MPDASDAQDWGEHSERADEIGLLAGNVNAPQDISADLAELDIEYDVVGEVGAWTGQTVDIYAYERDGDRRYAACWSERVSIDEVRWDSLVFESEPDAEAVETGAEIVNAEGV